MNGVGNKEKKKKQELCKFITFFYRKKALQYFL